MKKSILKAVASVLIMALLFALGLNLVLQLEVVHRKIKDTADGLFWQVEQLISASAANIEDIKKIFPTPVSTTPGSPPMPFRQSQNFSLISMRC